MSGPWMKGANWRAAVANEAAGRKQRPDGYRNMSCPPRTPVKMPGSHVVGALVLLWTPPSLPESEDPLDVWRAALELPMDCSVAEVVEMADCSQWSLPPVAPIRINPKWDWPCRSTASALVEVRASLWIRLRSSRTVFIAALHPFIRPELLSGLVGMVVPPSWELTS